MQDIDYDNAAHAAELALVATLLVNPGAVTEVADDLLVAHFDSEPCALVFGACVALYRDGTKVDPVSVGLRLQEEGTLGRVGGHAWLGGLEQGYGGLENTKHYAAKVKAGHVRRGLHRVGAEIATRAQGSADTDAVTEFAVGALADFSRGVVRPGLSRVADHLGNAIDELYKINEVDGGLVGLPTGFSYLDHLTGGLQAGRLYVLAGRPAMGKTSLALNMAANMALTGGHKVGVFSLEMSAGELTQRLLCTEAKFSIKRAKQGKLDKLDGDNIRQAGELLHAAPIFIHDSGGLSIFSLTVQAKLMASKHGLDVLFIDYLQLMDAKAGVNRQEGVAAISRGLKKLAMELKIPVVALSQLSRACEAGDRDGRPRLSDLRESGSIEQDADLVAFVFRQNVYDSSVSERKVELIVEKHRHGPTGTVWLDFEAPLTLFSGTTMEVDNG